MQNNNETTNYFFNMCIIKPNTLAEGKYNYFNEDIYKVLNHDQTSGPIKNTELAITSLTQYLTKKDFFEMKKINFENMLYDIEFFYNPNKLEGHSFQVKTCLDNDEELIMYIYDASIKDLMQYNHLASIMGPKIESVFGPVFITKIKKNGLTDLKHVDITNEDITKIWLSLKQIEYWNFSDNNWTRDIMFNNNCQFNKKADNWFFINIDKSIVFCKFKPNIDINIDLKNFLITNLHFNDILNEKFECIKICKLKTGEYSSQELNYNNDLEATQEYIKETALNAVSDYDKYQVVMESLFQNVSNNLIF
jgi:hypothetical protein